MKKILSISQAASLAIHTMAFMASKPSQTFSVTYMASLLSASPHHLSKVLQRLKKMGFITSSRGPGGGFQIGDHWQNTSLMDIYEAIEGPWQPVKCLLSRSVCGGAQNCFFGSLLTDLNDRIEKTLSETKLSDLVNRFYVGSSSQ